MADFLVGSVATVFRQGPLKEGPTFLSFVQIKDRCFWKLFFEQRRRTGLCKGSAGRGRGRGRLWPDDLWISLIWQDIVFVGALSRIDQKIESAIVILHFGETIGFPLRLLQKIGSAIAAFGQT